jgi:N-acetyl-beta-hexosaminidase
VVISDATPGATLYYTTNGTSPTTYSTRYTGPITVSSSETLKAIAYVAGEKQSETVTATYTITTVTTTAPVFTPAPGTYSTSRSVTITDDTEGATIYYTTNGTTPTIYSAKYSGPIDVTSTETIEAMADAPGHAPSYTVVAKYTIN